MRDLHVGALPLCGEDDGRVRWKCLRRTAQQLTFPCHDHAIELIAESAARWRVQRQGRMHMPAVVFASRPLLPEGDHWLR